MDLLRHLVRHATRDLYERRDGYRTAGYRRELARSQYLEPGRLAELQLARLRRVVALAYEENAFHRERLDRIGFVPSDLRSLSDLRALPLLTKDDLRDGLGFSRGFSAGNTVHKRTGGSTGVPVHVYMDFEATSIKRAAVERHNSWAGRRAGDRLAAVWGDTSGPFPFRERLRNALTERAFYLDTLRFQPAPIDAFIARLRALRPPVLMGHAHSVFRLAEHARERGVGDLRFRGIITTAMVLSPAERRTIEEVFSSPVFNRYGCEETSIIASECEAHQGMHVFAEGLYLELLEEPGTTARKLVITDLLNRAQPLLRYEIGDYARPAEGACPCGRTLPRLLEVMGRTADFLYTPDRVPVFGISILDTFVIHLPGFKQVQIVQDLYDHLLFRVVRDQRFSGESLERLRQNVRQIFGERMRYDVEYVERIEQTERGKFRFSICRIGERERPEV